MMKGHVEQVYRIVVIEENNLMVVTERLAHARVANFNLINTYFSWEDALAKLRTDRPDIVLTGIALRGGSGIVGITRLRNINPRLRILVMAADVENEEVFRAIRAGAMGFITTDFVEIDPITAIWQLTRGGSPLSPNVANKIVRSFHLNPKTPLTSRETDVLYHLSKGKTYSQIAKELCVSLSTVNTHVKHIYDKLHVTSKTDALLRARQDKYV